MLLKLRLTRSEHANDIKGANTGCFRPIWSGWISISEVHSELSLGWVWQFFFFVFVFSLLLHSSPVCPSAGRADNICLSDIRYQRFQTAEMTSSQSRLPLAVRSCPFFFFLFSFDWSVFSYPLCLSSTPISSALVPKQSSSSLSKANLLFNALWEGMHGRKKEGKTMVSVTTGVFRSVCYLGMGWGVREVPGTCTALYWARCSLSGCSWFSGHNGCG